MFELKEPFGLVLGGGSALGFAHVGVLKYLEELSLLPSELGGTSMGSVVASCYAIGLDFKEIEEIAKNINYFTLIDFDFKTGVLAGNRVLKKLQEIFGNTKIENCRIPLKIIATDVDTGEKIIFKEGKIIDAVRSSISLPGVISMYRLGNKNLIDGGIVNNLPIEVLQNKNVIAVSVLRDYNRKINTKTKILNFEFHKSFFGVSYQILQKTIDVMMKQNEDRSLNLKNKNIIFLHPNCRDIDYYEFHKYKEIIKFGYEEAKKRLPKI